MLSADARKNMKKRFWPATLPQKDTGDPSFLSPLRHDAYKNLLAVYQSYCTHLKEYAKDDLSIDISFGNRLCTFSFTIPHSVFEDKGWSFLIHIEPCAEKIELEQKFHTLVIRLHIKYFKSI